MVWHQISQSKDCWHGGRKYIDECVYNDLVDLLNFRFWKQSQPHLQDKNPHSLGNSESKTKTGKSWAPDSEQSPPSPRNNNNDHLWWSNAEQELAIENGEETDEEALSKISNFCLAKPGLTPWSTFEDNAERCCDAFVALEVQKMHWMCSFC